MISEAHDEPVNATCPDCKRQTRCNLLFRETIEHHGAGWWINHFSILRCRGCETTFFQKHTKILGDAKNNTSVPDNKYEWFDEYTYVPALSNRHQPEWSGELIFCDQNLKSIYDELYTALNSNLLVLSTIGVRTVLERAAEILDIHGGLPQKLEELLNQGYIGKNEHQLLFILKEAGNASAHRAWRPKIGELNSIVDVLDQFLHRTFVLQDDVSPIGNVIPPRK